MAAPSPREAGVSSPDETASQSPSLTMERETREQNQVQPKTPTSDNAQAGFQETMYTVRKRKFPLPFCLFKSHV